MIAKIEVKAHFAVIVKKFLGNMCCAEERCARVVDGTE
jgi:hypothetical protein